MRVTGSPYLEFDLGSPDAPRKARANYAGGDGTQDLVFGYTVRSDDRDDDGIEIPAGSIRLNDGAIQDIESGTQAVIEYAAAGVQAMRGLIAPHHLAYRVLAKTHIALALGLAACQKGLSVRLTTASHLVHEMIEARDEKRLLRLQDQLARVSLLIVDELGYVPLSQTGSELLFDVFSRRYETILRTAATSRH